MSRNDFGHTEETHANMCKFSQVTAVLAVCLCVKQHSVDKKQENKVG